MPVASQTLFHQARLAIKLYHCGACKRSPPTGRPSTSHCCHTRISGRSGSWRWLQILAGHVVSLVLKVRRITRFRVLGIGHGLRTRLAEICAAKPPPEMLRQPVGSHGTQRALVLKSRSIPIRTSLLDSSRTIAPGALTCWNHTC